MSTYLRKCIDIAPTAVITPGPFLPNDYRNLRLQPWWPALRATTSHLRLWADWPSLQHTAAAPGSDPATCVPRGARRADRRRAHADGMKIILLPYRYPRWANGTAGIPAGSASDCEYFALGPRSRACAQYLAFRAGRRDRAG